MPELRGQGEEGLCNQLQPTDWAPTRQIMSMRMLVHEERYRPADTGGDPEGVGHADSINAHLPPQIRCAPGVGLASTCCLGTCTLACAGPH
jgi:hypothetical protein